MEKLNVNYIIACFLGERRLKSVSDPKMFIRRHLDFLRDNNIDGIGRVTVVLNTDSSEEIETMREILRDYRPYYVDLRLITRENMGFSYSGWALAINQSVENEEDFTHYMLVEDDYAPGREDFLEVFASKMTEGIGYVAQKLSYYVMDELFNTPKHPAIACGLMSAEAARKAHDKYGSAILTIATSRYDYFSLMLQVHFVDFIKGVGYDISDCADISSIIFLHIDCANQSGWTLREYGNKDERRALEPVIEWKNYKWDDVYGVEVH